jgi:predicted DNA-binding transcriptional regulator YafY
VSQGGRDQLGPIERLVRVLAVLEGAGPAGASQEQLLQVARYGGQSADAQRRMLNRDIGHLNDAGWDIRNVAEVGTNARYVLAARDIRLRVELNPGEQAELARVGRIAGVDEFADYVGTDAADSEPPQHVDVQLAMCLEAAARRRVVQFIYKQRPRTVHPRVVEPGPSGWYLVGWEEGSGVEKNFVVDRMTQLVFDQPGTALAAQEERRGTLDPATWEVDPPVDVELATTAEFTDQVTLALRPVVDERTDGETTVLTVRVTNRAAFRMRLYALGARVRILGPDDVRAEIIDELSRLAGEA